MMNSGETQPTRPAMGSWLLYGATDDFGFAAIENKVHVHELFA